jgi:hypothetical protein
VLITDHGRVDAGTEISSVRKPPEDNADDVGTANEKARECPADLARGAEGDSQRV